MEEGHELANHMTLDEPYTNRSEDEIIESLDETQKIIVEAHGGKGPAIKWYRAPHARMNNRLRAIVESKGYVSALADVHSNDPRIVCAPKFHAKYLCWFAQPGSILLLHCADKKLHRQQTNKALRIAIPKLMSKSMGYKIVNLSQLHAECTKNP